MLRLLQILPLLVFEFLFAQEKKFETVYFAFDKFDLKAKEIQTITNFIKLQDTTKIESIQMYGYCDDRGENEYNIKLSKNRVETVKNVLLSLGISKNKIVLIEGRGRILVEKDTIDNLDKVRTQNRRVDLLVVPKEIKSGNYTSFHDNHKVGDRITIKNILFLLGSSKLTESSTYELDNIVRFLKKNYKIRIEIQGHVCCTPKYYEDGVDAETNERKLSVNRAKTVYRFLLYKGISSFRMTYKGYGNKVPLGKGDAFDRRVEFLITKV